MDKAATNIHWSEDFALDQLQLAGLHLVHRNYRTRRGEMDLVLRDKSTVVFVEVRYRATIAYGRPEETVGAGKQSRLRLAAQVFLQKHPDWLSAHCRFDVFAVSGKPPDHTWRWIPDAF